MLESKTEAWLKGRVEAHGDLYYKFTSPGNVGVPDRLIVCQGKVVFVELKQEHGVLSEIQKAQIRRLVKKGAEVRVVYGTAGAHKLIEEMYGEKYKSPRTPKTTESLGIEEWR